VVGTIYLRSRQASLLQAQLENILVNIGLYQTYESLTDKRAKGAAVRSSLGSNLAQSGQFG
jgi:hypothetical protein